MSFDAGKIYRLLPALHRLRDANAMGTFQNNPTPEALRELIAVIADQVAVLEEELEQLYDNQFVETAAPWALPYLGELLGLRGIDSAGPSERFAPRAEVANTIGYRRRKGTAAMLEQLAHDIMGRPSAAVEFWNRLATTQHLNHVRKKNIAWASVRSAAELEFIGTPFEKASRTIEVRRIEPGLGKWNIPNVGLFVWRLQAYERTKSPLAPANVPDETDKRHFRFHPLGLDMPLCATPETETEIEHLAQPINVPLLLTYRQFAGESVENAPKQFHPGRDWYGQERSVQLWKTDWAEVPRTDIVVCNLADKADGTWEHEDATFNGKKKILLDPMRGRVVFPSDETNPSATFHFLFPADIGGGEYARTKSFNKFSAPRRHVAQQPVDKKVFPETEGKIQDALDAGTDSNVIIEIVDSAHYIEPIKEISAKNATVELRARDGAWPVLTLKALTQPKPSKPCLLTGSGEGVIVLNGLLITGRHLAVTAGLKKVSMRHCTLLPGLAIAANGKLDGNSSHPIALDATKFAGTLEFENCILGPLRVGTHTTVCLRNCIVDAGGSAFDAISSNDPSGGGTWRIENCTIIGNAAFRRLELASNSIFHSHSVKVAQRQEGCVRFCSLPKNAVVPRQHKCVPRTETDDAKHPLRIDAQPQFVSTHFGDAGYCQLRRSCSDAIRMGADDESEMGVYHDLLEPRREAHLRARLRDYLRFGLEAGIFYEEQTPPLKQT